MDGKIGAGIMKFRDGVAFPFDLNFFVYQTELKHVETCNPSFSSSIDLDLVKWSAHACHVSDISLFKGRLTNAFIWHTFEV